MPQALQSTSKGGKGRRGGEWNVHGPPGGGRASLRAGQGKEPGALAFLPLILFPSTQNWATSRNYISGQMLLCGGKKPLEFRKFWSIQQCPGKAEKVCSVPQLVIF